MVAGPSFDYHVALIHEREQLVERMEGLQAEVQVLESPGTWYSIHLQDAETSVHLADLFQELERKRKESDTLVSTCTQNPNH